jgi:hypothetical protein
MREDYEKLFSHLTDPELSGGLFGKIIQRIQNERRLRSIKRRIAFFSVGTVFSIVAFIFTLQMARAGFAESGFFQFFSLLFSDFSSVVLYWRNFGLTLLETLPVVSLTVFLGSVLLLMELLKLLANNIKLFFNSTKLIS